MNFAKCIHVMVRFAEILMLASSLMLLPLKGGAQNGYDVFIPIAKYISQGDADSLSNWFADNLEVTVSSTTNDSSRKQATQIVKTFFSKHNPRSFDITHTASNGNAKYALGTLNAGGETYMVTLFVCLTGDKYKIQQIRINTIQ